MRLKLAIFLKPFSDMTCGKIRRICYRVYPQFTFHTIQRGGSQTHSQQQQILRIIQARAVAAGSSRQRQEAMYWLCCRDYVIFFTTNRQHQLLSPQTLNIFVVVFYLWVTIFSPWDVCFLLVFFLFLWFAIHHHEPRAAALDLQTIKHTDSGEIKSTCIDKTLISLIW